MKANSVRIKVLEEQNTTLRRSITKMLQAQRYDPGATTHQQGAAMSKPVPLWNPDDAVIKGHRDGEPQQQAPQTQQEAFERCDMLILKQKQDRFLLHSLSFNLL